jgi:hypothetical protein
MNQEHAHQALKQAAASTNFRDRNPHLTELEVRTIIADGVFPIGKPVFSPYRPAKQGSNYSQVRYEGVKYYLHRVAAIARYGMPPDGAMEASHRIISLNRDITGDFNPNNICWETGEENRARLACKIVYQRAIKQGEDPEVAARTAAQVCALVHPDHPCVFLS